MLAVLALGALELAAGSRRVVVDRGFDVSVPWAVVVPLLTGAVVATLTSSSTRCIEETAARDMRAWRALHLLAALALAVAVTAVTSHGLSGPVTSLAAVRNVLGFSGLALIASAVLGAALAWLPTMAFGIAATTTGYGMGVPRAWAWPIHLDDSASAWWTVAALAGAGIALVVLRGPRPTDRLGG